NTCMVLVELQEITDLGQLSAVVTPADGVGHARIPITFATLTMKTTITCNRVTIPLASRYLAALVFVAAIGFDAGAHVAPGSRHGLLVEDMGRHHRGLLRARPGSHFEPRAGPLTAFIDRLTAVRPAKGESGVRAIAIYSVASVTEVAAVWTSADPVVPLTLEPPGNPGRPVP